jgi:hypothetical protein
MRAHTARSLFVLVAVTQVAACRSDGVASPLSPSSPSRSTHANNSSDERTIRIRGTVESHETNTYDPATNSLVVHLEGTGTASHIGRFVMIDDGVAHLSTGLGEGRVTFIAANGDSFTATETGSGQIDGGFADVIDVATITGGTGRFAGAKGTLTILKRLDLATGLSSGSVDGTIDLEK